MSLRRLLDGLQNILVDSEGHGTDQCDQRRIREYGDHGEHGDGQQEDEHSAEHDAGLLDITPVDQGLHCDWAWENRLIKNVCTFSLIRNIWSMEEPYRYWYSFYE